ncbi:FecR family protein [Pedobacter heparinus]|uniref:FecR family protein n=1 Tax=Pedobacter heparinus TaxID=984 RepID=UPI00292F2EC2|nr:FecR domain-containing protein [Pedobacter heparinus]
MTNEEVKALLDRYHEGTCSQEERMLVESWYNARAEKNSPLGIKEDLEFTIAQIWEDILIEAPAPKARNTKLWPRIFGVAAAVAAITLGVWLYYSSAPRHAEGSVATRDLLANDIAPGKNTATLTLANGKTINLSDMKTGVVIGSELKYNDNTVVISNEERDLLNSTNKRSLPYGRDDGQGANSNVQMLTATTPRGGVYQVVLHDGSKLWLNADSKISFPSQFIGKERKILLLYGEVYFEVEKTYTLMQRQKIRQRFIVETMGQEVEVLGTHFNISAYQGEGIKTTLLEGSVRVHYLSSRANAKDLDSSVPRNDKSGRDDGQGVILKPNQQSLVTASGGITVKQVDVEQVVAWKNSQFMFESENIQTIMKMVERWYNVDVEYIGEITDEKFGGGVSRFDNVSKVLKSLESTGKVHFKIEGRKIFVSK